MPDRHKLAQIALKAEANFQASREKYGRAQGYGSRWAEAPGSVGYLDRARDLRTKALDAYSNTLTREENNQPLFNLLRRDAAA